MSYPMWFLLKIMAEVIYMMSQGMDKMTAVSNAASKYDLSETEILKLL